MRTAALAVLALAACHGGDVAAPEAGVPSVLLVLDRSGSMQGGKLDAAKGAMLAALDAMPDGAPFGVIVFDSETSEPIALAPLADRAAAHAAIDGIQAGGGTNLVPAVRLARERIAASPGPRHVILLSDGESPTDGIDALVDELRADGTTVSAVAIEGADMQLLHRLVDGTGGRFHDAGDLGDLAAFYTQEVERAVADAR